MSTSKTTAVKNPHTGKYEEVETASLPSGLDVLAGFVDLRAAGLGVSKSTFTDTIQIGPIKCQIRPVGKEVRLADDAFVNHAIQELGLEELASKYNDFSDFPKPDEARRQAALTIWNTEAYRLDYPELSVRADELVVERYEAILLGLVPDSDDPDTWGGLVGWKVGGVPATKFPFTVDNVKALTLQTKFALYRHILQISRSGVSSDAGFR